MPDARGESVVTIDGTEYTLRLTFAQGVKLEQRLGDGGLSALLMRFMNKVPMSMTEVCDVLYAAAVGGGSKVDRDAFAEAVWNHGYATLTSVATEVVMTAAVRKGAPVADPAEKAEKKG